MLLYLLQTKYLDSSNDVTFFLIDTIADIKLHIYSHLLYD